MSSGKTHHLGLMDSSEALIECIPHDLSELTSLKSEILVKRNEF